MKRLFFEYTLPLYALDQLTKWLVLRFINIEEQIVIIPNFFYLVHVYNTGAAFGMLRNNNWFFIGLSTVVFAVLLTMWWRGIFQSRWTATGVALLFSGILGNLTDRLWHGYVVDFLLFDLHVIFANPFPAFNIADSCICVAAAIFVINSAIDRQKNPHEGRSV